MRWNIIVECVGEDGKRSTITLGTIERLAGSTTAENLGVNLQESKQIANRLQATVVKQQLHEHCEESGNVSLVAGSGRSKTSAADGCGYHPGDRIPQGSIQAVSGLRLKPQ